MQKEQENCLKIMFHSNAQIEPTLLIRVPSPLFGQRPQRTDVLWNKGVNFHTAVSTSVCPSLRPEAPIQPSKA